MKRNQLSLKAFALTMVMGFVSLGIFAQDLKPYPVYFSLGDYPEFKSLAGWRNPAADGKTLSRDLAPSFQWTSDGADWNGTAVSNCKSVVYRVTSDFISNNSKQSAARTAYGDFVSITSAYNRMRQLTVNMPWVNPGTYRIYVGILETQTGGNAGRNCALEPALFDGDTIFTIPADELYANKIGLNGKGIATGGFSAPQIDYIVSTDKSYSTTGFYLGQVEVKEAGIHKLTIRISNDGGLDLGYDMVMMVPVTASDLDSDYEFPKFDVGGNVYLNAAYPYTAYTGAKNVYAAESIDSSNIIEAAGESMGVLPFQVSDPTAYTTYSVKLNAGAYFAGQTVAVLRAEDNWTRMFTGKVGADGSVTAQLPAGSYYCELNNVNYIGEAFTVAAAGDVFVGTLTGKLSVKYGADSWYAGKSFKVYSGDGVTCIYDLAIGNDGALPVMELPLGDYLFVVGEDAAAGTYFDKVNFSIVDESTVSYDFAKTNYNVSIAAGNDAFVSGAKEFQIFRTSNPAAVYVSSEFDAAGTFKTALPDGEYTIKSANSFINYEFAVNGADVNLDYTGRYALNFYPGVILNGYSIDVYKIADENLLIGSQAIADGACKQEGLINGDYMFIVKKDTVVVNPGTFFSIANADFTEGDAGVMNQPYSVPRSVYFDILDQPEIAWRIDAGKEWTNSGEGCGIANIELPVMPVYTYRVDTTWIDDTTYTTTTTDVVTNTTYRAGLKYTWAGTPANMNSAYANADYAEITMNATNCGPEGARFSIKTPIINKGRYNIWMAARYNGANAKPMLDTIMVDGKITSLQNVSMCFYSPMDAAVTDESRRNIHQTPSRRSASMSAENNVGNVKEAYLGWIDIETTGTHTLTFISHRAGCYYVSDTEVEGAWNEANADGTFNVFPMATMAFWADLIKFIPVAEDDPQLDGGNHYPLIDVCGYPTYLTTATGNNDIGTEGVNHIFAAWQQPDLSIYANENADYTSKLSWISGQFGAADQISLKSTVDNWTHYEFTADSITGNLTSQQVIPGTYTWQTLNEGIVGKSALDLNNDLTYTIPETLPSKISGNYAFTPSEDDPELGTVTLTATAALDGDYDFYYPVTGEINFYEFASLVKTDSIYVTSEGTTSYSYDCSAFEVEGGDQFSASYSGNGGRLQATLDASVLTGIRKNSSKVGKLSVYPNPAVECVNIELGNAAHASYRLINAIGQTMMVGKIENGAAQVQLKGAASGMYFLQVKANGAQETLKLMVK